MTDPSTTPLPHTLERTLLIRAGRDTVSSHFTDSARWAAWWGTGANVFHLDGNGRIAAVVGVRAPAPE